MNPGRMMPIIMRSLLILPMLMFPALRAGEMVALAHPGETLPSDKTVVWTPLFQAAWDGMQEGLGPLVKVDPPNPLMRRLDDFQWQPDKVMPGKHWRVWAGEATAELIDRANREAALMTGDSRKWFDAEPRQDARMALGLLERNLVFKRPLHRSHDSPLSFTGSDGTVTDVRFFGTRGKASANFSKTVRVLAYEAGTHAVEVAGEDDDTVVLYLPEKPCHFEEACERLRGWRATRLAGEWGSAQDPALHENDDLRIPLIGLEHRSDFLPQLQGRRYYESSKIPWIIHMARQHLKFELTERGAELRVKVETGTEPFGAPPPPPPMVPRDFHYDRPFFVFLWGEGAAWPYFGAWLGDATAMQRFKDS
jgi:hypothetical protein